MTPPISIDGTDITGATIDGQDVEEITVDGDTVFSAGPVVPDSDVNQWLFSEGSGTTVADESDNYDLSFNSLSWGSVGINDTHGILDGTNEYAELSGSASDSDWKRWTDEQNGTILAWVNPDSVSGEGSTVIGSASRIEGPNVMLLSEWWSDGGGRPAFEILTPAGLNETEGTPNGWAADQWMVLGGVADAADNEMRLIAATPTNDYSVQIVDTATLPAPVTNDLQFDIAVGRDQHDGGRRYYGGGLGIIGHRAVPFSTPEIQEWIDQTRGFYVD